MSTVYVFRGQGKMTARDADAFRAKGWRVGTHKHGLALTGAVTGTTLKALNRAGFWWEVVKRSHNPSEGCCAHHMDQRREMLKASRTRHTAQKRKVGAIQARKNPDMKAAKKKAAKKAKAWFSNPELETKPRVLKRQLPSAFVEIGTIEAIEYQSDKFDGESRLYRHDVTRKRKLLLSTDGSCMIVTPPFKVTKRGIEG